MEIIIQISNGDTIHENYNPEITIGEVSESIIAKYLPNANKIRLLFNSKFLDPNSKLSDIGYIPGKIIMGYPSPALKPKPKPQVEEKKEIPKEKIPQPQEKPKQENVKPPVKETPKEPQKTKPNTHKKVPSPKVRGPKIQQQSKQGQQPNKPNPKVEKVRNLILENPPNSLDAVISSISKNDPVLADRIRKNPAPFLALVGVHFTMDDGKPIIKTH